MNKTTFTKRYKLGKVDGENIYLSAPSWDCGWYWGFGYLGNNNCHYHVDGLGKESNKNMFDAIKEHFGNTLSPHLAYAENKRLWTFCELMETFYTLRETAEVLGRGGSHFTNNPIKEMLIDKKR